METAGEFYGTFDKADKQLLVRIRGLLERLPDRGHRNLNADHLWSCHDVCLALHTYLDLEDRGWLITQGRYIRYDHCWLYRRDPATILDVYPVASLGGPIMLDPSATAIQLLYDATVQIDTHTRRRAREEMSVLLTLMTQIDCNGLFIDLQAADTSPSSERESFDRPD